MMNTPTVNVDGRTPLEQQSWLVEFLKNEGFERISDHEFSNGKATLTFKEDRFTADPNDSERCWTANLHDADAITIKLLIQQILKMRPFLSDKSLASERLEKASAHLALTGIAKTIRDGPDTHSGVQLRRFLWSIYNGHHLVNLWRMTSVLDAQRSDWVAEIFRGALKGLVQEENIREALKTAGEMERWDQVSPSNDQLAAIDEAKRTIDLVLRALPPCSCHVELKHARDSLADAHTSIRRSREQH